MNTGAEEVGHHARRPSTAERYLRHTRWRLAAIYGLLLAVLLIAIVAATYVAARVHESGQIHDQLHITAQEKLRMPNLRAILRQAPRLTSEEEAVHTFIISPDGVVRYADAFTRQPPDPAMVSLALQHGLDKFSSIPGPAGTLSVYTVPILRAGKVIGAIQTVTAQSPYNLVLQYLLLVSFVVGGIGLVLAAALGILMADWGLRPIRVAIASQQTFVQNAAHELRAPLTLMRTAAELALRSDEPAELREALTTAIRQTEHLEAVVGDLRLVAQGDTGRLLVDREPLDLAALVRDVWGEMRPAAEARGIRLELQVPTTLTVPADRQRLRQLLMILADNALRYTPSRGRIDIIVRRHAGRAVLSVRDTGAGIEPRHLPHIFERFYRSEEARSQHEGGSGLGLAIAREIVEAHGGKITAQSRVGAGTTFRVTLPVGTGPGQTPAG